MFSQLMLIIVSCSVSRQILSWKSCWVIFFICKRQMQSNADKGLFILYIIAFKECSNHAQIRHAWLSQIHCRPEKNVKNLVPLPTYSYDPHSFRKGFFHKNEASEMPAKNKTGKEKWKRQRVSFVFSKKILPSAYTRTLNAQYMVWRQKQLKQKPA